MRFYAWSREVEVDLDHGHEPGGGEKIASPVVDVPAGCMRRNRDPGLGVGDLGSDGAFSDLDEPQPHAEHAEEPDEDTEKHRDARGCPHSPITPRRPSNSREVNGDRSRAIPVLNNGTRKRRRLACPKPILTEQRPNHQGRSEPDQGHQSCPYGDRDRAEVGPITRLDRDERHGRVGDGP